MSELLKIAHASVTLREVSLPNGLVIDQIQLNGDAIGLDGEHRFPQMHQPGQVEAIITEARLAAFLETQLPAAVRKIEVQLIGGKIQVAAIAKVVFEIRAIALLTLELVDHARIYARLDSVEPAVVRGLIETQIERGNPVFDTHGLPVPMKLERTEIEAGQLHVYGTFELNVNET